MPTSSVGTSLYVKIRIDADARDADWVSMFRKAADMLDQLGSPWVYSVLAESGNDASPRLELLVSAGANTLIKMANQGLLPRGEPHIYIDNELD